MNYLWIMDGLLCALLIGAMVVGTRLWRKIDLLRAGQEEMQTLMGQLTSATDRANAAVVQLRGAIKDAETKIGDRLTRARAVSDELSIITESGDRLASRLMTGLNGAPAEPARPAPRRNREPVVTTGVSPSESEALSRILQGLR
jgi:hypothetical protein